MKRNNILFIWNVFECRWVIILFLHIHQWIILYAACEQAFAAFFRLSLDWWSSDDIAAKTSVSLKYIDASIYRKICNSYFERCNMNVRSMDLYSISPSPLLPGQALCVCWITHAVKAERSCVQKVHQILIIKF